LRLEERPPPEQVLEQLAFVHDDIAGCVDRRTDGVMDYLMGMEID
jgi:hypothetical protein